MRSLESRIIKLETRTARPDEMLVVFERTIDRIAERSANEMSLSRPFPVSRRVRQGKCQMKN
jgi:hypothetical protein